MKKWNPAAAEAVLWRVKKKELGCGCVCVSRLGRVFRSGAAPVRSEDVKEKCESSTSPPPKGEKVSPEVPLDFGWFGFVDSLA